MQDLIGGCVFRVARLTGEFILVLFVLLGERDSNTGSQQKSRRRPQRSYGILLSTGASRSLLWAMIHS